jgi:mannosyltransferase
LTRSAPAQARSVAGAPHVALIAALFGALAVVMSAAGSWIPSLWADEVTSAMSAQRTLPSLLLMLQHVDAVHGTYYAGLHVWGSVFGFSPFSIRFPSALAVGFATAAVVLLADRLRSRRVAIIAGVVCAILPRVTYMGEEARSYAFSAAIVAWLTLILVVALERGRSSRRLWIAYGALLAVGICTFLYVALFVLVHAVVVLASRAPRRTVRAWAIASGCGAAAAIPVIVFALLEHGQVAYLGNTEQLAPDTLFSSLWFGQWTFAVIAWALIVVAVVFEVRRARIRRADGGDLLLGDHGRPSLALVSLLWLLAPTLVLMGMHSVVPDFTARYVSFCAPAAAILIACGLDDLLRARRWVGVVAGVLVVALIAPVYVSQRTPYAKNDADLAEISAAVGSAAHAGDAVVFDVYTRPSRRPRLAMYGYPAGFAGVNDVLLRIPYQSNITWHDETYTVAQAAALRRFVGVDRVWLVEYALSPDQVDRWGLRDLEALGFRATSISIPTYRALVTLYERTP